MITHNRFVQSNQIIYDIVDLFDTDDFTRLTGIGYNSPNLNHSFMYKGQVLSWPLVNGISVLDDQVAAGSVYWHEVSAGVYLLRFYPNAIGSWRLDFAYSTPAQRVSFVYDVSLLPNVVEGSVVTTFI